MMVFRNGIHAGKRADNVPGSYLQWVLKTFKDLTEAESSDIQRVLAHRESRAKRSQQAGKSKGVTL